MPSPGGEVLATVAGIIERELRIPAREITRDTRLGDGLGLSSMEVFLLLCDVEEEYSVRFGGDEVRGLVTVGCLVDAVAAKVHGRG